MRHANAIPAISRPFYQPALTVFAISLITIVSVAQAHNQATTVDASGRHIHFPDTEKYQTLAVDLHTHSVFSDGHVWPKIRVEEALRDGLDALAITEHLEYQPHRFDIPHPDRNTAYNEAREAAAKTDLIVIAGSEITRDSPAGHINAVFISDANAMLRVPNPPADAKDALAYYQQANAWPAQNAIEEANDQGAFLFWNHPYWTNQQPNGIARMNKFHEENAKNGKLHGIEIANGQDYSEGAHAIALKYGLAMIGVSDVHDLIDWDHPPHQGKHRPVTLVLAQARTAEAIKEALFAQRTVVWFRNLLIGREDELNSILDASLQLESARWRAETEVLQIEIRNNSDATFRLRNLTKHTFMHSGDDIDVAANGVTKISVKPGKKMASIKLKFAVENALVAPKKPATLSFTVTPENS